MKPVGGSRGDLTRPGQIREQGERDAAIEHVEREEIPVLGGPSGVGTAHVLQIGTGPPIPYRQTSGIARDVRYGRAALRARETAGQKPDRPFRWGERREPTCS